MITKESLVNATVKAVEEAEEEERSLAENLEAAMLEEAMVQAGNRCNWCHFYPQKGFETGVIDRVKQSLTEQGFLIDEDALYQHGGGILFSWEEFDEA